MKKLFIVLFTSLLLVFASIGVSAECNHIYIDPIDPILTAEQEAALEEDLEHIHQDYDISILITYDRSIPDDQIVSWNKQVVENNHFTSNTISFVRNGNYYCIDALGTQASLIESNDENLYAIFHNAGNAYEGYIAFYQEIVRLINSNEYTSNVDRVEGTPNMVSFSNLLSNSETSKLNELLNDLSKQTGIKLIGVLTDTLHGMTPQDYADDFMDLNGYPKDSILFMVSMEDRDWYISTTGDARIYVTDYGIDYIADEAIAELQDGDYYEAFKVYGETAKALIDQGRSGNIIDVDNKMPATFGLTNILIGVGIGLVVAIVTTLILNGQLKSVHFEKFARNYIVENSFVITGYADMFINKSVSRTARPKNDNHSSGGGGGGSSFHTSSSGISHGGHGGKF